METVDRYLGAMLGLAVGDALGTTLEFKSPGEFEPITEIVGGGPFHLLPGQWTDDTALALCLAESLIECKGFNPIDQLERYCRYWKEGYMSSTGKCFDIGITTSNALNNFEVTRRPYCSPTYSGSASNGSLMRLAPIPLLYGLHSDEAIEKSGQSSITTHCNVLAIDACRYFGALLVGAISGFTKDKILSNEGKFSGYWERNPLAKEICEVAAGSFKRKSPPSIRGSGYVVESLEAALWAFCRSHSFREGCCLAVNLGNDADTTGAIFGQLAGAYYGVGCIPEPWLSKIAKRSKIESMAIKIFQLSRIDCEKKI